MYMDCLSFDSKLNYKIEFWSDFKLTFSWMTFHLTIFMKVSIDIAISSKFFLSWYIRVKTFGLITFLCVQATQNSMAEIPTSHKLINAFYTQGLNHYLLLLLNSMKTPSEAFHARSCMNQKSNSESVLKQPRTGSSQLHCRARWY